MSPELSKALERTQRLFKERGRSEDWGRNILEGSQGITALTDWTKYYTFLTNPAAFDPNEKRAPMDPNAAMPPVPEGLREVRHQNGTETIIQLVKEEEKCEC